MQPCAMAGLNSGSPAVPSGRCRCKQAECDCLIPDQGAGKAGLDPSVVVPAQGHPCTASHTLEQGSVPLQVASPAAVQSAQAPGNRGEPGVIMPQHQHNIRCALGITAGLAAGLLQSQAGR
jgi:hypothetical protein